MRKTPTKEPMALTDARNMLAGFNIAEMAKKIGLNKNTLYNIARGISSDITASTYESIKEYHDAHK